MTTLQTFNTEDFGSVRTMLIDSEPWFVGKDVALALGYSNPSKAVISHVEAEDKKTDILPYSQNGNTTGKLTIINESGMYCLILSSKLPNAKKFKRWVTNEVLPAIRKTGTYTMPEAEKAEQRDITRDDYIRAASIVGSCRNERLPIVMKLLESSGLEIPRIVDMKAEIAEGSDRDMTGETARMINTAVNEYGFSIRRIERLTGISATELTRIRKGISNPKKVRMRIICNAIQDEIKKINDETE